MAGPLTVPVGELGSLGVIKETTFGVFPGAPSIFHGTMSWAPKPQNAPVTRSPVRKRYGQSKPATGAFHLAGSLDVESTPDTLGQLLAFALGNQSTPTLNILATTLSSSTLTNAQAFPVGTNFPQNVVPGETITIDTTTNQETLVVATPALSVSAGVWSILTTTGATKAHSSGVAVAITSTTAYASTMKLGALPSFSIEENRVTDAIDYLGCMVESLTIDVKPKTGLSCKFAIVAKTLVTNPSPTSPTFSTKEILTFENPNNAQYFNSAPIGAGGQVSTLGLAVTLNNNLNKDYFSGAAGRTVQNFPQLQRSGKATITLGFETNAAYQAFLGTSGTTAAPASATVPNIPFQWTMCGSDNADSTLGVPYMFGIYLPSMFPTGDTTELKTGEIIQTFEAELNESGSGNNDDLTIYYVGTASAIF